MKTFFRQKIILVIFGLFLAFILLELGLRLAGFIALSLQEYKNRVSISKKGAYRIMCLGESTTQGQYPHFLEEALNQRSGRLKFSVIDKGIAATNTSAILAHLGPDLDEYSPDMVVVMMGLNDYGFHMVYKTYPDSKITRFFSHFKAYNLARLVWLRILNKAGETGIYKTNPQKTHEEEGDFRLKENSLKKAIELDPRNEKAYIDLAYAYRLQDNPFKAEEASKKAIELNPNSDLAYNELARSYRDQGKLSSVEELLKKAIVLNPQAGGAYIDLALFYRNQHKFQEEEEVLKKYVEVNPYDKLTCAELAWCYRDHGNFLQAEKLLKRSLELNPDKPDSRENVSGALSILYEAMGKPRLARKYARKAEAVRLNYYNPETVNNYLKLKEILDKRNIRLVCVQYPVRSVEPLKKIFQGRAEGIVFVDNEKIFKDVIKKTGYKEYFRDALGGDFGHCTDKGNELLSGNIADTILTEVFGK
jgi:Tfp pilus assembly protein PilF